MTSPGYGIPLKELDMIKDGPKGGEIQLDWGGIMVGIGGTLKSLVCVSKSTQGILAEVNRAKDRRLFE